MTALSVASIVLEQSANDAAMAARRIDMKIERNIKVKGIAGAAVVALALTGVTGTAVAGAPVAKSKVTAGPGGDFKGMVKSDAHPCEANRLVVVYRIENGVRKVVGSDKTDSGGKWQVEVNITFANQPHFAIAKRKETDKVTCQQAKSPEFVLE